ncbi:MAG: hypothetical protein VB118_12090 [Oscillospiraceae bacterium]|nr:hypothetical protein [Oscillospiraceae bacterium]
MKADIAAGTALQSSLSLLDSEYSGEKNMLKREKQNAALGLESEAASKATDYRTQMIKMYTDQLNSDRENMLEIAKLNENAEKWRAELKSDTAYKNTALADGTEKWRAQLAEDNAARISDERISNAKLEAEKAMNTAELEFQKQKQDAQIKAEAEAAAEKEKQQKYENSIKSEYLSLEKQKTAADIENEARKAEEVIQKRIDKAVADALSAKSAETAVSTLSKDNNADASSGTEVPGPRTPETTPQTLVEKIVGLYTTVKNGESVRNYQAIINDVYTILEDKRLSEDYRKAVYDYADSMGYIS